MTKVVKIELKAAVTPRSHELTQCVDMLGLPIGRQAHYLVLVAVTRKTEVLRQRLVEDAERMWEIHLSFDGHGAPATQPPGRACEVTETVHRDGGGFVERRDEKCRSEVREMVVNVMSLSPEALARERLSEQFFCTAASGARAQFLKHQQIGRAS